MPTCLKCKTYNNEGNVHCKNCEAVLPVASGDRCPQCAALNGPFASQCKACGVDLKRVKVNVQHKETRVKNEASNVTNLKTYKKKRKVKSVKQAMSNSQIGAKIVLGIFIVLFVIGVFVTIF